MEGRRVTRARRSNEVNRDFTKLRLKNILVVAAIVLAAGGAAYLVGQKIYAGAQAKEAERARERARQVVEAGNTLFGGSTRQEIYNRLGQPLRIDDSVVRPNRFRKGWDQIIYRIHYEGLVIEVQRLRTPGEPERETLSFISLSTSAHKLPFDLAVGVSKERVRSVLGVPTREEPGRDVYEIDSVLQKQVRFGYLGDAVTSIEWRF